MKRWLKLTPIVAAMIIGVVWLGPQKPSPDKPIKANSQTTNVVPDTQPTQTLVAQAATPDATASAPAPITPVDTTIFEADSSAYSPGQVNTLAFTTTGAWSADFSYSGGGPVSVRVISSVSGLPQNFIVNNNPSPANQFSFLEQKFDYPVYVEIKAASWHIKISDSQQTAYQLITPQTSKDWQCEALFPHCPFTPDPVF